MIRYLFLAAMLIVPGHYLTGQNTVAQTKVAFLERDAIARGNWKGNLGRIGYEIPGYEMLLPKTIQLNWAENVGSRVWQAETEDTSGLQTSGSARVLACRFAPQGALTFSLDVGQQPRKVTFYCHDGDHKNRSQRIQIFDTSEILLDEIVLASFDTGARLSWAVQGKIVVNIVPCQGSPNAVISGIFIDELNADVVVPEKSPRSPTKKKIDIISGVASHGYGGHEYGAGALYLAELLESVADVDCVVHLDYKAGRPLDVDDSACVVFHSDGYRRWPLVGKLAELEKLKSQGCGLVFLHYATLPNQEHQDQRAISNPDMEFVKQATGAVYELFWTVNPFFTAEFTSFVDHPITRGVKPFSLWDEWYFHLRFHNDLSTEEILEKGVASPVVPILVCVPPDEAKSGPDDIVLGNPTVRNRKGQPEIVACAVEREDGGRGFHFTGADVHWNFRNANYRKILVNGILWTAGLDVPESGFHTPTPTMEQLEKNMDGPKPANWSGVTVPTE